MRGGSGRGGGGGGDGGVRGGGGGVRGGVGGDEYRDLCRAMNGFT